MPGDAPHFPPPGHKDAYRAPAVATTTPSPKVVTRPEPPSDALVRPKLTPEEMRALLAVEAAKRPPWRRSVKRSAILLPVTIVAHLLGTSMWALAFSVVAYVAVLVWIARPLFRRDGFS